MQKQLFLVACLLLPACAEDHSFTARDALLEGGFVAACAFDASQTAFFSLYSNQHFEDNPVLGSRPSRPRIALYFLSVLAAHAAITIALTGDWRFAWQTLTLGAEGAVVTKNFIDGAELR